MLAVVTLLVLLSGVFTQAWAETSDSDAGPAIGHTANPNAIDSSDRQETPNSISEAVSGKLDEEEKEPESADISESGDGPDRPADELSTASGGVGEVAESATAPPETMPDGVAVSAATPDAEAAVENSTDKRDSTAKEEVQEAEGASATGDATALREAGSSPAIPTANPEPTTTGSAVTAETVAPDPTSAPKSFTTDADRTARSIADVPVTTAEADEPRGFEALFTWVQRTFFNRTPTVSFDPASLIRHADGSITGAVIGHDADGDVLAYSAAQPVTGGSVTMEENGSFTFIPTTGVADGADIRFAATVSDHSDVNGWHIHGLLGLLVAGYGSTASTTVSLGMSTSSSAGGRYGWGTPRETRFTSLQSLSSSGWKIYNSVGHNGWGRRTPAAISFVDGTMVITGDAAGNTGGLAWTGGQRYGAWEIRAQIPRGAADYHAVALLWPDAENWPVGGEIDFVEILGDSTRQTVSHFLHYSAQNRTESAATRVNATQWHNYAVSWTPQAITVYVDGAPTWQTTNTSHFPPGPMHLALQLDASEKRPVNLSGGAQMAVAWTRQYTLDQIT